MPNFALKEIEGLDTKEMMYQLIIDGIPQLDKYEENLQSSYQSQFRSLISLIEESGNFKLLPKNKFRVLDSTDGVKEFEYKTKDLRVYAIKTDDGRIIVLAGFKNRQDKEMRKFRQIKAQYLESLKTKN
jgi:hypothetical protein